MSDDQTAKEIPGLSLIEPSVRLQRQVRRSIDSVDPGLRSAFTGLYEGVTKWPLFLWGNIGVGKTCSALCFADRSYFAEYFTLSGLADDVMGKNTDPHEPRMDNICRSSKHRLVILDEIGAREKIGDLERSILQQVLDARAAMGFPLIAISNQPPNKMYELYGPRIASRLGAGTVYHLTGKDRRRK